MRFHFLQSSKQVQRFRSLSKKLGAMIEDGSFQQLSKDKQLKLANKLFQLFRRVRNVFSNSRLRRTLASAAVLISMAGTLQAQSFAAPVEYNSGLVTDDVPVYHFADVDGDGDQDAFMSVYGDSVRVFKYQENTGTAETAQFGDAVQNPWGVTVNFKPTTIDLADVDNDGDLDLFMGSYDFNGMNTPIYGWENTGTPTNPAFNLLPALNPFSFQPTEEVAEIAFVDLDGDGDEDVLMNHYDENMDYEQFQFQDNLGTMPTFPVYANPVVDPFGLSNMNVETYVMDFDDVDNDGDQDLLIAGYDGSSAESSMFYYYENTGTAMAPAFAANVSNPFNLQVPDNAAALLPAFVDIDGDGDCDILATVYSDVTEESTVLFYENLGDVSNTQELSLVSDLSIYPTVADQHINWELTMKEGVANSSFRIVDMHGRIVFTQNTNLNTGFNQGTINTAALSAGMYVLQLADAKGTTLISQRFYAN